MSKCKNLHIPEHAKMHQELEVIRGARWKENLTDRCPKGWQQVKAEVYTDGKQFVIIGQPLDTDDIGDQAFDLHNCDDMGCGRDHVLYRGNAEWLP